ncbi:MAG TPA: ABC transporter permease [Blastocatellia bacterium]
MSILSALRAAWRNLLRKDKTERDLSQEIESYIDLASNTYVELGMDHPTATRKAAVEFGGSEQVKERVREIRFGHSLEVLGQDLRYATRILRKTPGFTAVVVLTLALGIGANTAIFSVVNSTLLQPLPFRDPNRLVRVFSTNATGGNYPVSGEDYFDWQSENRSFEATTLFTASQNFDASGAGQSETVSVISAQANFFSVLGVRPHIGREFVPGEDTPANNHVAVLSYGLWQRHFGGSREVVGKKIDLNFQTYDVVGVMPRTFNYPESTDVWVPLEMTVDHLGRRGGFSYRLLARLKPGVSVAQAQADMTSVTQNLAVQYPISNSNVGARVVVFKELLTGDVRPQLLVLLGAVALVMLVACANVANLLLARAAGRQREVVLRSALGATRWRLLRQLMTESVVLSLTGAMLGLIGAWWFVWLVQSVPTLPIPRENPIQLDGTVLLFTLVISIVVGILFGLVPALEASRLDLNEVLKAASGAIAGVSGRRRTFQNVLVVAEVATSLALLAGAGLLLQTFARLRNADIGVRSHGILTAAVVLPKTKYSALPQRREFCDRLLERLEHAPGVTAAAISQQLPLEGSHSFDAKLEGDLDPQHSGVGVDLNYVSPDYFRVFGIPFLSGRVFTPQEIDRSLETSTKLSAYEDSGQVSPVPLQQFSSSAVINQTMAQAMWPNQDVVGKIFIAGVQLITVVGVIRDIKYGGIRDQVHPQAYFPLTQELNNQWYPFELSVSTDAPPEKLTGGLRAALDGVDSDLSLFRVRTMDQIAADDTQDTSLQTVLLGAFAALGLVLSAIGIYAVMAYSVTQRRHEMGVRVAIGAQRRDILLHVLSRGLRLALLGAFAGVIAALALTRLLSKELFGITASDPLTLASAAGLLVVVALGACYIPARRALSVDPLVALRYE